MGEYRLRMDMLTYNKPSLHMQSPFIEKLRRVPSPWIFM
jgi:hypothetical protein